MNRKFFVLFLRKTSNRHYDLIREAVTMERAETDFVTIECRFKTDQAITKYRLVQDNKTILENTT